MLIFSKYALKNRKHVLQHVGMSKNRYMDTLYLQPLKENDMERTLILLKPAALQRGLVGEILKRFENKGFCLVGMKMMQLGEQILEEHYFHLNGKPYFPNIKKAMSASPVIACCIEGLEAVKTVRLMCGATNGREAQPGTIRGDFSISVEQNVIHASDTEENAAIEIKRFFSENELFPYYRANSQFYYAGCELN